MPDFSELKKLWGPAMGLIGYKGTLVACGSGHTTTNVSSGFTSFGLLNKVALNISAQSMTPVLMNGPTLLGCRNQGKCVIVY